MKLFRVIALLLISGSAPEVSGASKSIIPPQPVPVRVRVIRNTAVEIPLRVYGDPGGGVIFEVRRAPEHGKVSAPRSTGRDSGMIIYQQADDGTHFADRFSVVARTNAGVSAPAEMTIRIVDPDSIFVIPEEIDFGTLKAGSQESREFVIENRGGGVVEGRIQSSPDWEVQGEGSYRLAEGQKQTVTIAFKGAEEREYRGYLHYSSHPSRETELRARVETPIGFSSKVVELKFDRRLRKRIGSVEILNREDQPQTVQIEHGERLSVPEKLELAGHEKAVLNIEVPGADVERVDEKLLAISGQYLAELLVKAPPIGPVLEIDKQMLSFEDASIERASTATLQIENIGGSRAFVRAEAPAPFQVRADDSSFTLEPGARRAVRIAFQPPEAGAFRTTLRLKFGDEELLVPVEARAVGQRATVYARPQRPSVARGEQSLAAAPGGERFDSGTSLAEPAPMTRKAPAITGVKVRSVDRNSCTLAWRALDAGTGRYVIERRELSLRGEELEEKWVPVTGAAFAQTGREVHATIQKLAPNSSYFFRVSAVEISGELSEPSFTVSVKTPQAPPIFTPMRVLSVLLVGMLIAIWRQRRAAAAEFAPPPKPPPSWRFRF